MENEEATQLTQGLVDPRRLGRNNSGLSGSDVADVICILHPCTPAAFRLVAATAQRSSKNVLQRNVVNLNANIQSQTSLEEQETFIIGNEGASHAMDLAFRFSCLPINPLAGYVFGRHEACCDIVLSNDTHKRVSNRHFAIFLNDSGILMLKDMSTNGTVVDEYLLRGKSPAGPQTRMLNPGSIIQILSPQQEEIIKFIVRVPSRDGHYEEYDARFQEYMRRIAQFQPDKAAGDAIVRRLTPAQPANSAVTRSVRSTALQNQLGMHWSGGDRYNVIALIGKGAFATVYQLATKSEGKFFAAKELEKRKFMKNGILDHKLDNEMKIMKDISHPNIVKYIDYHDHAHHLYIIMEFVPYGDLQNYLSDKGPLKEDLGKRMSAQVLDSLAYLHAKRITHRDIKPDNILLADDTPENFTIKLSDFGLSKVVTDNETFLKTFCGTLLYCAPEVFPHYDAHVAGRGYKRARKPAIAPHRFHSYSQSVDIWSYGAVLWYSLCLKPPFEGVADTTGRGMFDKIMMTPLNATNLAAEGISDAAISLLFAMLNIDPASRPSPILCLSHEWLVGHSKTVPVESTGLLSIAEEDLELDADRNSPVKQEEGGRGSPRAYDYDDEASVHSDSFNFFDPRLSKRFKSDAYAYRSQDGDPVDSSPELMQTTSSSSRPSRAERGTTQLPTQPKLFGEISESQFALLNFQQPEAGPQTPAEQTAQPLGVSVADWTERQKVEGIGASPSLLGAESLLRDVHMCSPKGSMSSSSVDPRSFDAPKTPANGPLDGSPHKSETKVNDVTPRPPQPPVFNRQIDLPIRASFFYDPSDPDTHNPEYASRVSGHDFKANPTMTLLRDSMPAPDMSGSLTEDDLDGAQQGSRANTAGVGSHEGVGLAASLFVKPPPRLGRLVSTEDSFISITINLTAKLTCWGRNPNNTHVYPDPSDIRIPKRGIIILFDAQTSSNGSADIDLAKVSSLQANVLTESRVGIRVNGVYLDQSDGETKKYGMLYTGDEIVVMPANARNNYETLKFRCEFYHGESKQERPPQNKGFQVRYGRPADGDKETAAQTEVKSQGSPVVRTSL